MDRYPGDPEWSNQLYRGDQLAWEEVQLTAMRGDELTAWRVKHDRDAFKEVWLLFENRDGRFPLYPGETTWIDYPYRVRSHKWGSWWQRAIRLPTRWLSMTLVFPASLQPVVWGIMTSMAAEDLPFPAPIARQNGTIRWCSPGRPTYRRYDHGSNGVLGPITLSLVVWCERCTSDRDTRRHDEEEDQAGAER